MGCLLYNRGWHDESSPSTHFTMSSLNSHSSSSVPPSSSSSGDSYFYPVQSSPLAINPNIRWPSWLAGPVPRLATPDPESTPPELRSQLDWDPRNSVLVEVGEDSHGRYVHRFPLFWLGKLIGIPRMHSLLNDQVISTMDREYFSVQELQ